MGIEVSKHRQSVQQTILESILDFQGTLSAAKQHIAGNSRQSQVGCLG